MEFLAERPPWLLAGVLVGLIVVGLRATINERIGVLGGFSEVVERVMARRPGLGWRAAFLVGVVAGGVVFTLLRGTAGADDGYGWLTRELSGDARVLAVPILVAAGALIGYGAKTAGGCTSGNGLGATSAGSAAGLAATATFMGTAIAASFAIRGLVGAL